MNTDQPDYRAEFEAEISATGALTVLEQGRWLGWLMRHAGKRVTVSVTREKRRRTDQQNKRYWALIVPCFSEWSGYEKHEAHEVLLGMFSKYEERLPNGKVVERILRSSEMTVEQFNDYTSRVERFLIGEGFAFPEAA